MVKWLEHSGFIAMAIIIILYSSSFSLSGEPATVKLVGPVHNIELNTYYNTIQDGLNHAFTGNTIEVAAGTYYENLYIWDSITLIGENRTTTIIDGSKSGNVIYFEGMDVQFTLRGFSVINSGTSAYNDWGIDIPWNAGTCIIQECIISSNAGGIHCGDDTYDHIISNNIITNNYYGIFLDGYSSNCNVYNNTFNNNNEAIVLAHSVNNRIYNNNVSSSTYHGIGLYSSSTNNRIYKNEFWNNGFYGWSAGIRLYQSDVNYVYDNKIANSFCDFGIHSYDSSRNIIYNNYIFNNPIGVNLEGGSYSNRLYNNSFINNDIQAYDSYENGLNYWNETYPLGGNYWSEYIGVDIYSGANQDQNGSDGIGDTPYLDITGGADAQDHYPLKPYNPAPLPFFNISLNLGWNLISIPLKMTNISVDNVLLPISGKWDVVKYYDSIDKASPWKSFRQGSSSNNLDTIDYTMGFWINITQSNVTLTVNGLVPTSATINLFAGWNLIGYPSQTEQTFANALWGTGADMVEVFDLVSPYIKIVGPTDIMKPGEGYWVHVSRDTVWTVDW